MAGERILVIDDSPRIRSVLRQAVLEPEGYTVLTAHDGEEGLKRALEERPDLVLLDVYMPRMTGLEVLQKLHEAQYEWPVILMTSHGSEETAVQAFRLGVRDYLRKPFKIEEVLARVQRTLVESQLRRDRERLLKRLENSNQQLERRVNDLITLYAIGDSSEGDPELKEPEKCEKWGWFKWSSLPSPLFLPIENLIRQGYDPFRTSESLGHPSIQPH